MRLLSSVGIPIRDFFLKLLANSDWKKKIDPTELNIFLAYLKICSKNNKYLHVQVDANFSKFIWTFFNPILRFFGICLLLPPPPNHSRSTKFNTPPLIRSKLASDWLKFSRALVRTLPTFFFAHPSWCAGVKSGRINRKDSRILRIRLMNVHMKIETFSINLKVTFFLLHIFEYVRKIIRSVQLFFFFSPAWPSFHSKDPIFHFLVLGCWVSRNSALLLFEIAMCLSDLFCWWKNWLLGTAFILVHLRFVLCFCKW